MSTVPVKGADGATYPLAAPGFGPQSDVNALAVSLSNESKAVLQAIVTALGTPVQAGGSVTVSGVATATNQATANGSLATIAGNTAGLALHADVMALITALGSPAQAGVTATDSKLEAVRALLAGTLAVSGPLTASQLTSAALATHADIAGLTTALGSPLQAGGAVTVAGVATATNQATANGSLAAIATSTAASATHADIAALTTALGSPLQAGGAVSVANLPATQAISATALPLPAGAATATGVAAVVTALGTPLQAGGAVIATAPPLSAGTDRSGTITTGGTAQPLAAANAARVFLKGQNISTGDLWINETGGTAAVNGAGSYVIPARQTFSINTNRAISIYGASSAQAFTATEG